MWVDSNGCISDASDCKYFVGTVAKGVEPSVEAAVLSAAKGTFKAGSYIGTLANNGTQLEYGGVMVPAVAQGQDRDRQGGHHRGHHLREPEQLPAHTEITR